MRNKLETFTQFTELLYPHEIEYLISIQQFSKDVNLRILHLIHFNSKNPFNTLPFDGEIDKRTYSYLKKWITESLNKIDVDIFFEWLTQIDKQVMTDAIIPDQERQILDYTRIITPGHYYFIRFYELILSYRDYLLIRIRNRFYKPIINYLDINQEAYLRCKEINEKLNDATIDIIRQHETIDRESKHWENLLLETFYNKHLDGYSRYRAAVRLTFMYYNYREFEKLRELYSELDRSFKSEVFYSPRLMANYYANRAMMHSKLGELEESEKYGYLSIRHPNSDYLFYLVNLCGVLLKQNKNEIALKLMSSSIPMLKQTNSFYNRIGFVAFYVRTLLANKQVDKAIDYAGNYLECFKKEIFAHRWHLFFDAYFRVLLHGEKYGRILHLSKRFSLIQKERQFVGKSQYLPILLWYTTAADYLENNLNAEQTKQIIYKSALLLIENKYKEQKIKELLNIIHSHLPDIIQAVRKELHL